MGISKHVLGGWPCNAKFRTAADRSHPHRSTLRAHRRPDTGVFQKTSVNFDPDIVPTDESIALSGDWHPLEHWGGDTFRWVSRSAAVTLLALEDGMESIAVELEPGPGIAE